MVVGVSQQTAQPSQWQEHTTSGGHKGWINRTTGEFREQVARPGSRQPGQEEGQPKQAKQQAPAPPDARQRADAINRNATNGVAAWAIWKATPADQMPTVAAMMSPEARQAVHNQWQKAQGQPVPAKPVQQKPQVPAGPWTKGSPPPEIGKVYNAPTSALNVDPTRFQYKLNVDSTTGVGAELKEIKAFNPDFAGVISVWKDPLDGKTWVVNGHHRFELAQRTGHPEMAVRYVQADSARKARAVGALINIAEGRGTAIDAAKFMRDMGVSQDEMERRGVSFKGKLAEDAAVLVKLNDRIFQKVALGIIEPNKAVAVAKHLDNPQLQDQLFDILDEQEAKGKQPTMRVIEEMAREFSAAPVTQTVRRDLFGEIIDDHSTFVERNQLKAFVRSELSKEVNDFLLVSSKRRAKKLAGAGNVIDVDENRRIAEEADRIRNVYDTLVNRKGELADALNDAAVQYAAAKNKRERDNVQQQAVSAVKRAVFREAGIGEADPGGKGSGLFSIPEGDRVGGGQDQTEALDAERRDSEPPRLAEKRKGAWFAKLLLRAIPHADTFAEAVAAVDAAMAIQPFAPESAKLSIDIFSRKAQAVLSKALKAARKISASARRELSEALDKETPQQVVEAVSDFVERYYARLASLLGPTQLASLLQGASEVVARIPYVAPFGTTGAPVPPSLGPDEAGKIVKRLAKLTAIEQAQEVQELPVEHQTYIREALAAGPPTAPPPFEVAVPVDDSGEAAQFVFVEEAVKELSGKNCLTREEYDALEAATRQKALTVAGVVSQETLEKIRDALAENIAEGVDFRDFKAKILEQVEPDTFLSDAHMENVFRSNVQAAFSDGQMNVLQNPVIRNGFPYAGYYAIHDDRVRCNHLALEKLGIDGTNIYRIDDPVFRTFRPPWDYQDRCSWVAMTVRMAADKGCVEAQNWLSTGVEPSPPAFVPMPAFGPPASFQRALAGSPLSIRLSLEPLAMSAMLGMVGDEWHGPEAPGPGWVQISVGPHGGKVWKQGGKAGQGVTAKKRTTKLDPGSSFPPGYWASNIGKHLNNPETALKVWRSIPKDQREGVKKLLSPEVLLMLQTVSFQHGGDGQSVIDKIKAYTEGDELVKRLASTGDKTAEAKKQMDAAYQRFVKSANAYLEASAAAQADRSNEELQIKSKAALALYEADNEARKKAAAVSDKAIAEARAEVEVILKAKNPTKIPGRKSSDIGRDHALRIDVATRFVGAITQEAALGNVYHFPLGETTLGTVLSRRSAYYEGPSPNNKIVSEPSNPVTTIVHEYGHYLENNLPGAKELAGEYIKHRCGSELPVNLKQMFPHLGYDESERGRKDKFDYFGDLAYYVGKVYLTGDTELVSMGLEYLYRDAAKFAAAEPEYCKLLLGILHGELRHVGDHSV